MNVKFVNKMRSDELDVLSEPFGEITINGVIVDIRRVIVKDKRPHFTAYIRVGVGDNEIKYGTPSSVSYVEIVGNNKWIGIDTANKWNENMDSAECLFEIIGVMSDVIESILKEYPKINFNHILIQEAQ